MTNININSLLDENFSSTFNQFILLVILLNQYLNFGLYQFQNFLNIYGLYILELQ